MGIIAKNIIHEARVKIMELPVFEQKVDVIGTLLDLEWNLGEKERKLEFQYGNELADDIFDTEYEQPWND